MEQVVLGTDRDLVGPDRAGPGVDDDLAFGPQLVADPPQPDLPHVQHAGSGAQGALGREPEVDGGFSWEKTDLVDELKGAF